jgi:hypothetical protein
MPMTAMALVRCSSRREIGRQRHHGRGNGAGALQGPAHGDHRHGLRQGSHRAAKYEQGQAAKDHGLASDLVGQPAQGNLQHGLREPVGAERKADQQRCRIGHIGGVQRQQREGHEQAQHAKAVQQRQMPRRHAAFQRGHGILSAPSEIKLRQGARSVAALLSTARIRAAAEGVSTAILPVPSPPAWPWLPILWRFAFPIPDIRWTVFSCAARARTISRTSISISPGTSWW